MIILFSRVVLKDVFATFNSQLGHDLPILVNDRMILPFPEGLIFRKLRIFPRIKPSRKFQNLQWHMFSCFLAFSHTGWKILTKFIGIAFRHKEKQ